MAIKERVMVRLAKEESLDSTFIDEAILGVSDRLKLRLRVDVLPSSFESIVVEAVVKVYRRLNYEGISSESVSSLSTSFQEDVLAEYANEISSYLAEKNNPSSVKQTIKFI